MINSHQLSVFHLLWPITWKARITLASLLCFGPVLMCLGRTTHMDLDKAWRCNVLVHEALQRRTVVEFDWTGAVLAAVVFVRPD